jgi:hypothetical protein
MAMGFLLGESASAAAPSLTQEIVQEAKPLAALGQGVHLVECGSAARYKRK